MNNDELNQKIIDALKRQREPIRRTQLWRALGFVPHHYNKLKERIDALVDAGVCMRSGKTCGSKYKLVEGW